MAKAPKPKRVKAKTVEFREADHLKPNERDVIINGCFAGYMVHESDWRGARIAWRYPAHRNGYGVRHGVEHFADAAALEQHIFAIDDLRDSGGEPAELMRKHMTHSGWLFRTAKPATRTEIRGAHAFYTNCEVAEKQGMAYLVVRDGGRARRLKIGAVHDRGPYRGKGRGGLDLVAVSVVVKPNDSGLVKMLEVAQFRIDRREDLRPFYQECVFYGDPQAEHVFLAEPPSSCAVSARKYVSLEAPPA